MSENLFMGKKKIIKNAIRERQAKIFLKKLQKKLFWKELSRDVDIRILEKLKESDKSPI